MFPILAMIIFNGFTLPIYGLTIALFSCRCPLLQLVTRRTHIAAATHNFNHLWKKVVYILHPNYDYMPVKSASKRIFVVLLAPHGGSRAQNGKKSSTPFLYFWWGTGGSLRMGGGGGKANPTP